MPFDLPVQLSGFGPTFNPVQNGNRNEQFSTADIIRAAVVAGYAMGRRNINWRIRAWRLASIRMALDLPPAFLPGVNPRLSHPRAWGSLDPSEKASVNNLLGTTITKLLCERLLGAPRIWFLDVYGDRYSAQPQGPNRPDFFARTLAGDWLSVEAKGRSYGPSSARLAAAKNQAQALASVNGVATKAHVVCWTMERSHCVSARLHDPPPSSPQSGALAVELAELVRDYYAPVEEIMEASHRVEHANQLTLYRFEAGDFAIGIHPVAEELLRARDNRARHKLLELHPEAFQPIGDLVAGPDGIIVVPGNSWPA